MADLQKNVELEMSAICANVPTLELFRALRYMTPGALADLGYVSLEDEPGGDGSTNTMRVRRVATYAALIYGADTPMGYGALGPRSIGPRERERFAGQFIALLVLSQVFLEANFYHNWCGWGYSIVVDEGGVQFSDDGLEEARVLLLSWSARGQRYWSPFSRIGEFAAEADPVLDPYGLHWDQLGDRIALLSSHYERDPQGVPGYRIMGWPLDILGNFLAQLTPGLMSTALNIEVDEFMGVLGGLCLMVRNRIREEQWLLMAVHTSALPFLEGEIEGQALLESIADYMESQGLDPKRYDLGVARDKFLYLATSSRRDQSDPLPLQMNVGDTRYSYLLHKFEDTYLIDFFHADHWLNRPLDMLASKMSGREGSLKGSRVEDHVWEYMRGSSKVQTIEKMRGMKVRKRGKRDEFNDLDCPLRLGDTLILVETKGQLLQYPAEVWDRAAVEMRWEANVRFIRKIDETARVVAERHQDEGYREHERNYPNLRISVPSPPRVDR